jgi:hypothetical protein
MVRPGRSGGPQPMPCPWFPWRMPPGPPPGASGCCAKAVLDSRAIAINERERAHSTSYLADWSLKKTFGHTKSFRAEQHGNWSDYQHGDPFGLRDKLPASAPTLRRDLGVEEVHCLSLGIKGTHPSPRRPEGTRCLEHQVATRARQTREQTEPDRSPQGPRKQGGSSQWPSSLAELRAPRCRVSPSAQR